MATLFTDAKTGCLLKNSRFLYKIIKTMPRVSKTKMTVNGQVPAPAKKPAAKKNKLYNMPEKIKEGTILTDLAKVQWCVGPSIGVGGFGEIYSAARAGGKTYDYVVKCEPHGNGPLFVEMHFYMRNAKLEDMEKFKRRNGLKSLGMPYMIGNGSADINGIKHRFIVMPRYGSDIAKFFLANGKRLPEGTIYRLAIQMLDVYQFVHSCGYVHADLKAANILLGLGKVGAGQAYLVDFGLASHYTTKEFKPDPKKMHNGTVEYTSRDAHQGVATMRGDFEILGYNLIEWCGVQLPWVRDKLLVPPTKAQKAKEEFMNDVDSELKKIFSKRVPVPIAEFMCYVSKLKYNDTPDYSKCRNIFFNGLKLLKIANTGDLEFKLLADSNKKISPLKNQKKVNQARNIASLDTEDQTLSDSDSVEIISSSDDDDDDENDDDPVFEQNSAISKEQQLKTKPLQRSKKKINQAIPVRRMAQTIANGKRVSPVKRLSPKSQNKSTPKAKSPQKRTSDILQSISPLPPSDKRKKTHSSLRASNSSRITRQSSQNASARICFSPSISLRARHGRTIVNDDLTPTINAEKTYEFNFELDVSMDANVIVNVKRNKKARKDKTSHNQTPSRQNTCGESTRSLDMLTPEERNRLSKTTDEEISFSNSPRTPAVTIRKYRH